MLMITVSDYRLTLKAILSDSNEQNTFNSILNRSTIINSVQKYFRNTMINIKYYSNKHC